MNELMIFEGHEVEAFELNEKFYLILITLARV